ncbi:MAG: UDP-N-acetylmuramoyl-tripeptide--D-alanyl-D-alanine ligase [Pseudomonadota bacterium]
MIPFTLEDCAKVVAGKIQSFDVEASDLNLAAEIKNIVIDSREDCEQALFVCIKGENFDGHDFAKKAMTQGAIACITERVLPNISRQILVKDARLSLRQLATYIRDKVNPLVVAVTGSNGKTTVKEMLACVFNEEDKLLVTQGNYNNEIGVPLTLFRLESQHKYAVIEMGANHAQEIATLTAIAKPNIAIITNIGPAHLDGFGSLEGVAHAKSEIFQGLEASGVAIINGDTHFVGVMEQAAQPHEIVKVGCSENYHISVDKIEQNKDTLHFQMCYQKVNTSVSLSCLGEHNAVNAGLVFAAGIKAGLKRDTIIEKLQQFKNVGGRLSTYQGFKGAKLLDDAYNANFDSVKAGLATLAKFDGYRLFVFGDMYELGKQAEAYHQQVGEVASQLGIDEMCSFGKLSQRATEAFTGRKQHFDTQSDLVAYLQSEIQTNYVILLKGSRGVQLDQVVNALKITEEE